MIARRFASKAFFFTLALGLALDGLPAAADAPVDQSQSGTTQKKPRKFKMVCAVEKDSGKKVCRRVSSADPQVAKSSGFFGTPGGSLLVGGAGITAAAVNGKNCGRGNNNNTGGGQNNGNCANSP